MNFSSYHTKLVVLFDELKEFRPLLSCECDGMKSSMDQQQQNAFLQFLMGLNESSSHLRAQISLK